jgi:hypothetical protein
MKLGGCLSNIIFKFAAQQEFLAMAKLMNESVFFQKYSCQYRRRLLE